MKIPQKGPTIYSISSALLLTASKEQDLFSTRQKKGKAYLPTLISPTHKCTTKDTGVAPPQASQRLMSYQRPGRSRSKYLQSTQQGSVFARSTPRPSMTPQLTHNVYISLPWGASLESRGPSQPATTTLHVNLYSGGCGDLQTAISRLHAAPIRRRLPNTIACQPSTGFITFGNAENPASDTIRPCWS